MEKVEPKTNNQINDLNKIADTSKLICPVCGHQLIQEKCKIVCRSSTCVYLIIFNCSEF